MAAPTSQERTMIPALLVILVCQLAGEALSRALHVPVPGPVMGMVLMVAGLMLSPRLVALVRPVAQNILGNLLILFVPAGVGAAGQLTTLGERAVPVMLAVVASTILAIIAGAMTFVAVARLTGNPDDEGGAILPVGKGGR